MIKAFLKQLIQNQWNQNWRRALIISNQEFSFKRLRSLGFGPKIILDIKGYEVGSEHNVLLTVSLIPFYKNISFIDKVFTFIKREGLVFYDVCSLMSRPQDQVLSQFDFFLFQKNIFF